MPTLKFAASFLFALGLLVGCGGTSTTSSSKPASSSPAPSATPAPDAAQAATSSGSPGSLIAVVVEGSRQLLDTLSDFETDGEIRKALAAGLGKRAVARDLARRTGRPAREIYARAVALADRETENGKRKTKSG